MIGSSSDKVSILTLTFSLSIIKFFGSRFVFFKLLMTLTPVLAYFVVTLKLTKVTFCNCFRKYVVKQRFIDFQILNNTCFILHFKC